MARRIPIFLWVCLVSIVPGVRAADRPPEQPALRTECQGCPEVPVPFGEVLVTPEPAAEAKAHVRLLRSSRAPLAGATTRLFVPVVLSAGGAAGSYYSSELTFTNRGTTTVTVNLEYTASFGGGDGVASFTLGAGRQQIVPDAIPFLRSLGIPIPSEEGGRGGTLRVRFDGLSSPTAAAVTVRTTTRVADGRAGLAYGGLVSASAGTTWICGLRHDTADRSNLALQHAGEPGSGDVTLRVSVYSSAQGGAPNVISPDVVLAPGGFTQLSGLLGGLGIANGYVKVERLAGTAPYSAYGVINDQFNSDGSFVSPLAAGSLKGKRNVVLPVAVESGAFTTELVLTNFSDTSSQTISFEYVADAVTASGNVARFSVTLKAREQLVIPSLVQYMRDKGVAGVGPAGASFAGALYASAGDFEMISIGARTSSPGGGGRYGLFYGAVPTDSVFSGAAWVDGLQQNEENRSNLAIVNTATSGTTTFTVELFDGETGQQAGKIENIQVGPRKWLQLGSVLTQGGSTARQGYAKVTQVSGPDSFLTYAVINDGAGPGSRSGDGAFLSAARDCEFTLSGSFAFNGPFGWSGGDGAEFVSTDSGCAYTVSSSVPWITLPVTSLTNSASVEYTVAANTSAASRSGELVLAGQSFPILQLGNAPGAYDGTWTGTTSQSKPISMTIERNEVIRLTLGLDVSMAGCRATGSIDFSPTRTRAAVSGTALKGYLEIPVSNGRIEMNLESTFSSPSAATGRFGLPIISGSGSVCITSGFGAGATFTLTKP